MPLLNSLLLDLDPGEAEAIVVALELRADYILIDEYSGRNMALSYNLQPLGVLGILVRAKQKGLIPAVKPLMDRLRQDANFFISNNLYQYVIQSVGE